MLRIVLIMSLCFGTLHVARAEVNIKSSVVKVFSVHRRHNYDEPWQLHGQRRSSGSGCIIANNRIITNAHVVADQTFIQVKRAGQARKYTAKVVVVAHECDLALLEVEEDSFFESAIPLTLGTLPSIRDDVAVYGFPIGGDSMCITEGVVSRVEHDRYSHSSARLLTCQIDAAINPGSSGGPVIKDNKIVGIAFQGGSGENIGYMVPAPIINHFLEDIADGTYEGIPKLGISCQKMESPDIRASYHMDEDETGTLINKVYPGSPATDILMPEDVLLSIDGNRIANNGTIEFRPGERTSFGYVVQSKHVGESVLCTVLRDAKQLDVSIQLSKPTGAMRLVPNEQYDVAPTYYILGGLVFEPLTKNFLREWGKQWYSRAPRHLTNYYLNGELTEDRKQVIVLVKVLPDEINLGYHDWGSNVVTSVNGSHISSITDLVEAFESNIGDYHVIVDEAERRLILDRKKVDAAGHQILKKYRITSDRSEDLKE